MKRMNLPGGRGLFAVAGVLAALLTARGEAPIVKPAIPPADANMLGGADRYLTFVSTDKPMYRPGEKLFVRSAVLHSAKHTPSPQQEQAMVEITGPKGDIVASGMAASQDAVAGFSWEIPPATAGGEYSIKVSHPYTGHVPGVRKFDVRAFRAPRLKSQIVFVRDGYGAGDIVSASVHVDRAEGGIPANAKVTTIARVDGAEVYNGSTTIDAHGNASAQFPLPKSIERGEGTLAFVIEDGGIVETASKTIPILLQTLDLTMYPEGGDLVAGVTNRVYLEAFTPAKKPADLAGVIVDQAGAEIASVTTAHEGRGRFEFKPQAGQKYTLKITQPAGIKTTYPLPEAKPGVALAALENVTPANQPVKISFIASVEGMLKVTISKQEKEIANKMVPVYIQARRATADRAIVGETKELSFDLPADADGVLVATVWNEKGLPLAERLLFRAPARAIKIDVKPDLASYIPGQGVKLNITTTDESGKPISAMVGLTVTDDAVLEMIEKREQSPRLPVMVLLEADVKDLADAHVYLDPANPKAPQAVDLLLGTQGWRRFAFARPEDFIANNGDRARRILAMRVVTELELSKSGGGVVFFGLEGAAQGIGGGVRHGGMPVPAPMVRPMNAEAKPKVDDFAVAKPEEAAPAPEKPQVAADIAKAPEPAVAAAMPVPALRPMQQNALADKLEQAQAKDMAAGGALGLRKQMAQQPAPRNDFILVREFAHAVRPDRKPADRVDFTETLYWNAGVKTDATTGLATVTFATSDAVTSFRVFTDAFASTGALGSSSSTIQSVQPFYVEMKMPLEVTQGDEILLPVTFINGTAEQFAPTVPQPTGPRGIRFGPIKPTGVPANTRSRYIQFIGIDDIAGSFDLTIAGSGNSYTDKVTRKLKVKPRGFPIEFAKGGMLGPESNNLTYEIKIPADLVAASVTSDLAVYPTPLANLTQALEALIQSPCGCFEQTSSTTYPLVMAQQYFTSHQGVDPKIIERSRTLLDEGYSRLVGFECKTTKGFEWFGADPGHDALSAYGLLEFTDMSAVRDVDRKMLDRTREFVIGARDGQGGYKRLTHTLHTWIADPECNNGYVTWSLLECGTQPKEMAKEIAWIKENIAKSSNTYAIALGANVLAIAGDSEAAKSMMNKLVAKQTKDGMVDGATTSVIGSGGEALQIETTALATLAWLRYPEFAGNVEHSMKWLAETCKAGRFGSTQSTILALRAIVTYDKARARPKAPGTVQVMVDGKPMGSPVAFDEKTTGAIKLQDISEMMSPGKHTIALKMDRGAAMPFSLAVRYNTLKPNSSEACKLTLRTALRDAKLAEGGITEAVVNVENKTNEAVPTPIAIIGIPGGLEVRHDQLKELVKSGKIDAYEVLGREVVLYWRSMSANQKAEIPLSLTAAIPGNYSAPASRAYLYYTDEHKAWTEALKVEISAK